MQEVVAKRVQVHLYAIISSPEVVNDAKVESEESSGALACENPPFPRL